MGRLKPATKSAGNIQSAKYAEGSSFSIPKLRIGMKTTKIGSAHAQLPRLVLHFDVNKTLIMVDPVQGKDLHTVINDIVAECAMGTVEMLKDANSGALVKSWVWDKEEPADRPPSNGKISYGNFLRQIYSKNITKEERTKNKRRRRELRRNFTDDGHPGENLRGYYDALMKRVQLPSDIVGTAAALECGLSNASIFILPSFFAMILWLTDCGADFKIIFRTFGDDISHIAKELNAFCEGRHPLFPEVKLDGTRGSVDRRLHLECTEAFGCFFRSPQETVLIYGELSPPSTPLSSHSHLKMLKLAHGLDNRIKNLDQLYKALCDSRFATTAYRDYYPWWFECGERAQSGKLLPVDDSDTDTVSIFFDDNILFDDAHIIDVRSVSNGKPLAFCDSVGKYIIRVNPMEAILRKDYYTDLLRRRLRRER